MSVSPSMVMYSSTGTHAHRPRLTSSQMAPIVVVDTSSHCGLLVLYTHAPVDSAVSVPESSCACTPSASPRRVSAYAWHCAAVG